MRNELLDIISRKAKTEFVLNVLLYADFTIWPLMQVKDLIDAIGEITNETKVENNRILLSYNPILTICLSCAVL